MRSCPGAEHTHYVTCTQRTITLMKICQYTLIVAELFRGAIGLFVYGQVVDEMSLKLLQVAKDIIPNA